jgi:hypothetical protein
LPCTYARIVTPGAAPVWGGAQYRCRPPAPAPALPSARNTQSVTSTAKSPPAPPPPSLSCPLLAPPPPHTTHPTPPGGRRKPHVSLPRRRVAAVRWWRVRDAGGVRRHHHRVACWGLQVQPDAPPGGAAGAVQAPPRGPGGTTAGGAVRTVRRRGSCVRRVRRVRCAGPGLAVGPPQPGRQRGVGRWGCKGQRRQAIARAAAR